MIEFNNTDYTRLLLIRHGQTEHNAKGFVSGRNDIPINETGHQQAKIMAERVKAEFPVDVIYSSPLKRAIQTAQYLSDAFMLPVIPDQNLIEYGFGEIANTRIKNLRETQPSLSQEVDDWFNGDYSDSPVRPDIPGSESFDELKNRIQAFTDMILEKHAGKLVAAVSHGGFIKSCLFYHIGGDFSRYVPFWVDNVSLSIIDFYKGRPVIRLFNDNSHIHEDLVLGHPRWL